MTRPVVKIDRANWQVVGHYTSAKEAAKANSLVVTTTYNRCNNKRVTQGSRYVYRYADDYKLEDEPQYSKSRAKRVRLIDTLTGEAKEYNSTREAAILTGIKRLDICYSAYTGKIYKGYRAEWVETVI